MGSPALLGRGVPHSFSGYARSLKNRAIVSIVVFVEIQPIKGLIVGEINQERKDPSNPQYIFLPSSKQTLPLPYTFLWSHGFRTDRERAALS
jgi:hypothetical protein